MAGPQGVKVTPGKRFADFGQPRRIQGGQRTHRPPGPACARHPAMLRSRGDDVKLSPALKAKRNELISELHQADPSRGYLAAIQEGCRIVRQAIAIAEAVTGRHLAHEPAEDELTAADFATMPAGQLETLILRSGDGPRRLRVRPSSIKGAARHSVMSFGHS